MRGGTSSACSAATLLRCAGRTSSAFQFDQRITAHLALAAVLWLQGYPDQAMRTVESKIEDAYALHHELSLCNALAKACPVALLAGDLEAAERFVGMLLDHAARNALASWQAEARCFPGRTAGQARRRRQRLCRSCAPRSMSSRNEFFSAICRRCSANWRKRSVTPGEIAQGLATIDQALARSERNDERWCIAELLRIKGELIVLERAPGGARCGRAVVSARPRVGPPARRPVVGAALRDEPRAAMAHARSDQSGARTLRRSSRALHGGLRNGGPENSEGTARDASIAFGLTGNNDPPASQGALSR